MPISVPTLGLGFGWGVLTLDFVRETWNHRAVEPSRLLRVARLIRYLRPSLLAIDEVGYLAYDAHAADLLFQVVSRRYEQKSIVITTNLPFKQWDTVFPNAACAVALMIASRIMRRSSRLTGSPIASGKPSKRRNASRNRSRSADQTAAASTDLGPDLRAFT